MNCNKSLRCNKYSRKRRGTVIVLIAFILPVLFILVGFSIDLANMQRTRTELRTATDLATKAAAAELSRTGSQSDAIAAGKQIANANLVAGDGLTLSNADFEFGTSSQQANGKWAFSPSGPTPNSVRITGARTANTSDGPIDLFFGEFFGQDTFEPTVQSAAAFMQVDICLVLDRSSSMKLSLAETGGMSVAEARWCATPNGSARWRDLDNAVGVFFNEMRNTPGRENLAMVTFGGPMEATTPDCNGQADHSVVSVDQGLTTNITLLEDSLAARSNSVWNGNTDIKAGLQAGINVLLNSRQGAQRILILFTDGQYTEDTPVPLSFTAAANGIMIHTITFGNLPSDPANNWIADMQAISANSGGTHAHAPNARTLEDVFEQFATSISMLIQ